MLLLLLFLSMFFSFFFLFFTVSLTVIIKGMPNTSWFFKLYNKSLNKPVIHEFVISISLFEADFIARLLNNSIPKKGSLERSLSLLMLIEEMIFCSKSSVSFSCFLLSLLLLLLLVVLYLPSWLLMSSFLSSFFLTLLLLLLVALFLIL